MALHGTSRHHMERCYCRPLVGTRGAPHRARRYPTRKNGSRLGVELNGGDDTHGLERRPPVGTRGATHRARRAPTRKGGSRRGVELKRRRRPCPRVTKGMRLLPSDLTSLIRDRVAGQQPPLVI